MGATVVSLGGAFAVGQAWAFGLHGLVVAVFAAYLIGLRRLKKLAVERRVKVRYFPVVAASAAVHSAGGPDEVRQAGGARR